MIKINFISLLFLISAFVLFTLFYSLIQSKSKSKARKYYNWFILSAGLWLLSDFIEYSSSTYFIAKIGMLASYFFISITLFFLAKTIFKLQDYKRDWFALIPLSSFILLSPFFDIKKGTFVLFNDLINLPLSIFLIVEFAFFLFLVLDLFMFKKQIRKKEVKIKLTYFAYILLFIVSFNFFYYLISSYYLLVPLTWFSAILFSLLTYPLFND